MANDVHYLYNGFHQLLQEYQEHDGIVDWGVTPVVNYEYADGINNTIRRTAIIYPGGRTINYVYGEADSPDDLLNRVAAITEGESSVATYARIGLNTSIEVQYPEPDVKMSYISQDGNIGSAGDFYTGLDRFGRVADIRWLKEETDIDRSTYEFDRASNRVWRHRPTAPDQKWDERYLYDGLYQLTNMHGGKPESTLR